MEKEARQSMMSVGLSNRRNSLIEEVDEAKRNVGCRTAEQ